MQTTAPITEARAHLAEKLLRGVAHAFLSFFMLYVKLLGYVLRIGIKAVKNARRTGDR